MANSDDTTNHDTLNRLLSAAILFFATLAVDTFPVHAIEFFSKSSGSKAVQSQANTQSQSTIWSWLRATVFVKDRVTQFLAQVGAGVLLYTALIHMMPEIRENYETYKNETEGYEETVPALVDMSMCAGFFGMFLIEEVVHALFLKDHDHHGGEKEHHDHDEQFHAKNHQNGALQTEVARSGTGAASTIESPRFLDEECGDDVKRQSEQECDTISVVSRCDIEKISNLDEIIRGDPTKPKDRPLCARIFDALMLILAFSCHSIFDGISIAVQERNKIWTVLIAILSHKLLIAFILSVQVFHRSQLGAVDKRRAQRRGFMVLWVFGVVFAAMSPLGIFIVLALQSASGVPNEKALHIIILAAISSGTILYIVFLEIIDKASARTHINGIVQLVALVVGFVLMHLVSSLFKEDG